MCTHGYSIGKQNGFINADEIRALENLPQMPDGLGEVFFVPLNMVPIDQAADTAAATSDDSLKGPVDTVRTIEQRETRNQKQRQRMRDSFRSLFLTAMQRIVTKESDDVKRAAKRLLPDHLDDFRNRLAGYQLLNILQLTLVRPGDCLTRSTERKE